MASLAPVKYGCGHGGQASDGDFKFPSENHTNQATDTQVRAGQSLCPDCFHKSQLEWQRLIENAEHQAMINARMPNATQENREKEKEWRERAEILRKIMSNEADEMGGFR